jgi:hypothetical protein
VVSDTQIGSAGAGVALLEPIDFVVDVVDHARQHGLRVAEALVVVERSDLLGEEMSSSSAGIVPISESSSSTK